MTKKKTGTTTKTKTKAKAASEPSAAQIHVEQTQLVVDAFPGKALEILAADLLAVETTEGARKVNPRTDDPALLRRLHIIGKDAVHSWTVLPKAPKPAEFSLPPPSREAVERAEQNRRIEKSHTHKVDMRRILNEDRGRAGLPPLP